MKKYIGIIVFLCVGVSLFFFWKQGFQISNISIFSENEELIASVPIPETTPEPMKQEDVSVVIESLREIPREKIFQNVPFTSQAPTGKWKDPVFQNGCEEVALLMAEKWASGQAFGIPKEVAREIREITETEQKYFPQDPYDLSVADTLFLSQKYFPQLQVALLRNVTKEDLKNALFEGNIIIIPANGQKLQNPNFTAPGPLYHTLLLRGYDPSSDEFITNDPGTRKGDGYRYPADTIFYAMQDYETGHHGKRFPDEKVMLVIRKDTLLRGSTSQ